MQKMNLKPEQVNVNGGAVSLGHPLGSVAELVLLLPSLMYLVRIMPSTELQVFAMAAAVPALL
jgi:hypothetical protein